MRRQLFSISRTTVDVLVVVLFYFTEKSSTLFLSLALIKILPPTVSGFQIGGHG